VALSAGATTLPGLVGNVAIPRKTSASAASWIATEGGASSNSEPQFEQIAMSPKTLGCNAKYSRQLLLQSTPSIEALVRRGFAAAIATGIDVAALTGDGASGAPTGITNTSGISTSTVATPGQPTWAEVVEFETDVDSSNALMGSTAFVTTPAVVGHCKTTEKVASTGKFIMEDNNSLAGYPLFRTGNVGSNGIIFGDFSSLLIGLWSGLDVIVDPYTEGTSGNVTVTALASIDINVKHPESFSINA
jgi:HK97 family phage major capsid protein